LHIGTALVILWPGVWRWSAGTQLRIFFLHNFLLGWISSALLGVLFTFLGEQGQRWDQGIRLLWFAGIGFMIAALLGIGLIQFLPVSAALLFRVAAWSSIFVVLAAGGFLVRCIQSDNARAESG
ncbi:MAG: hypothetical protein KDE58_41780, partial [Caldilineaceae bacterium]|nr:hypothetical protein [Caldilineaceae bacterium]